MIVDGITCDATAGGWRLSATVHSPSENSSEHLHFTVQGADPSWWPEVGDTFADASNDESGSNHAASPQ